MGTGHVIPDGTRIRHLRLKKGWTPDQLAGAGVEAGIPEIDVRTVRRAESNKAIQIASLILISKKLAVEHCSLLTRATVDSDAIDEDDAVDLGGDGQVSQATSIATDVGIADVVLKIDASFPAWTNEKQFALLDKLRRLLCATDEIRVVSRREGCVELVLRTTPEIAHKIVQAFLQGDIAELNILTAHLQAKEDGFGVKSSSDTSRLGPLSDPPPYRSQEEAIAEPSAFTFAPIGATCGGQVRFANGKMWVRLDKNAGWGIIPPEGLPLPFAKLDLLEAAIEVGRGVDDSTSMRFRHPLSRLCGKFIDVEIVDYKDLWGPVAVLSIHHLAAADISLIGDRAGDPR